MVDAKALVVIDVVGGAAAEPDDQPPLGDMVEHRELLGEAHRMMQRGLHHGKADRRASRCGGERAGKAHRVDISADAVEMVLGEPDHIDAELVRQRRLAQGLVDDDAVALRLTAVRKQEIAKVHLRSLLRHGDHDGLCPHLSSNAACQATPKQDCPGLGARL